MNSPSSASGRCQQAFRRCQGFGIAAPSQLLSMLPYVATILVLVLISRDSIRIRLNAPAAIGKVFHPDA